MKIDDEPHKTTGKERCRVTGAKEGLVRIGTRVMSKTVKGVNGHDRKRRSKNREAAFRTHMHGW